MKVSDILAKGNPTLSFEVFPPKTSDKYESVLKATEEIAALSPDFMSVTYGAGGGTSKYTFDIAQKIMQRFDVPVIAHLTCVSSTKETEGRLIRDIIGSGIENIMALRGDIPDHMLDCDRSGWAYHHAIDLIREIRERSKDVCIGGACYPEVHPESANRKEDVKYLKEKVDAGVDFLTTQMFFDNDLFYNFLYRIRELGITVPVVAGIMPITSPTQIERAIKLSGSFMPRRFLAIVDRFGGDALAFKQAGIAYAVEQIIDLMANGINHIHVYTMNKPDVALTIQDSLSYIIPNGRKNANA